MSSSPQQEFVAIFLDIDGVLRPFGHVDQGNRVFPPSTLAALSHVLTHVPQAQLVLSSTWRVQGSFIDIIVDNFQAFGGVLQDKDFDDITDPNLHTERQHEIHEWLTRHPHVQVWIALDDEELLEGEPNKQYRHLFENRVVKTDSHTGMTMDDANLAFFLLQEQMRQTRNNALKKTGRAHI